MSGQPQPAQTPIAVTGSVTETPTTGTTGLAATFSVSSVQRLAIPWVMNENFTVGQLTVFPNGNVGKCITGGMTGTTAPTTTGESITDGAAVWIIRPPFARGFRIVNNDSITPLYWDFWVSNMNVAVGSGGYLGPGASTDPLVQDPSLIQVIASSSISISVLGAS